MQEEKANFFYSLSVCVSSEVSARYNWYVSLEGRGIILYFCSSKLDSCSASSRGINQESPPLLASLSEDWLSWRGSIESAVTHKVSHCSDQGVIVAWLVDLEREQEQLLGGKLWG